MIGSAVETNAGLDVEGLGRVGEGGGGRLSG